MRARAGLKPAPTSGVRYQRLPDSAHPHEDTRIASHSGRPGWAAAPQAPGFHHPGPHRHPLVHAALARAGAGLQVEHGTQRRAGGRSRLHADVRSGRVGRPVGNACRHLGSPARAHRDVVAGVHGPFLLGVRGTVRLRVGAACRRAPGHGNHAVSSGVGGLAFEPVPGAPGHCHCGLRHGRHPGQHRDPAGHGVFCWRTSHGNG